MSTFIQKVYSLVVRSSSMIHTKMKPIPQFLLGKTVIMKIRTHTNTHIHTPTHRLFPRTKYSQLFCFHSRSYSYFLFNYFHILIYFDHLWDKLVD